MVGVALAAGVADLEAAGAATVAAAATKRVPLRVSERGGGVRSAGACACARTCWQDLSKLPSCLYPC